MNSVIASLLKRVSPASLVLAFAVSPLIVSSAQAQTYPTFPNSHQNSNQLHRTSTTVGASPTLVTVGTGIGAAYVNPSGNLVFSKITGGVTMGGETIIATGVGADNTPAAANLNGTLYVTYALNGRLYSTYSTNQGASWQPPVDLLYPVTPSGRPSTAVINGQILLTVRSGNTIYFSYGNGTSYGATYPIQSGFAVNSNPTAALLSQIAGGVAIIWVDPAGHPVSAKFAPSNLTTPSSITEITGVQIGGDPATLLTEPSNTFYIFGRSYYSADNLWAIETDGQNFGTQMEYGQTLTNSPSLIVDPNNGNLITQLGRSNFGSNIWAYSGH